LRLSQAATARHEFRCMALADAVGPCDEFDLSTMFEFVPADALFFVIVVVPICHATSLCTR
jgi:hypothetical protein